VFFSSTFRTGAALFALAIGARQNSAAQEEKKTDPWTNAQVLHAADLASELGNSKGASTPVVVYVGFRTLFEGGHVPQATFHGTASKEDGVADLKKWLATLPRSTNLVIYCGCCPFDRCPNIRPAYTALRDLGFTHVRVLVLPTSFAADWVEKGYPMQKGL
jgi:thiosulfate/3-mercaptopyruvate sulfurtransferase